MDQPIQNFPPNSFFHAHKYLNGFSPVVSGLSGLASGYDLVGAAIPGSFNFEGTQRKSNRIDGCISRYALAFGLENPVRSHDTRVNSKTAACSSLASPRAGESSSMLDFSSAQSLGCGFASGKPNINLDLSLSLSIGVAESDVTSVTLGSSPVLTGSGLPTTSSSYSHQSVDEGSTSSKWRGGSCSPHLVHTVKLDLNLPNSDPPMSNLSDYSVEQHQETSAACTATQQQRRGAIKICQAPGCQKGARGASGRCISHGGGRRCQKPGCQKGAEGRTIFCKAHGGGRRCEELGCTKSAEGRTSFCIAHGGGRRCSFAGGCNKAARGRSGLCIRHGGGKRCKMENCTKSAEGLPGFCIAHGGGRRCQYPDCNKGAQGSTKYCKAHGGGKRCTFPGCSKGAEGSTMYCKGHGGGKRCTYERGCTKSVHGGTLFCVAHGGGKRCAFVDCTKSARGKTSFCVRHGGGKRCMFESCSKSAQGRTDFCKAHGGGRRCLWGQAGSKFEQGDGAGPCEKFARGKLGLCAAHTAHVEDKRIHGGNGALGMLLFQPSVHPAVPATNGKGKEIVGVDTPSYGAASIEGTFAGWNGFDFGGSNSMIPVQFAPGDKVLMQPAAEITEGRVHGGGLMALLRANGGGVFGS